MAQYIDHPNMAQALLNKQTEINQATKRNKELLDQRDAAYNERARLLALLGAVSPGSVMTLADDVEEPGWHIFCLPMAGFIHTWHISPEDSELFKHIPLVPRDDPRAQWDGHTTEDKYNRIQHHIFQITRG